MKYFIAALGVAAMIIALALGQPKPIVPHGDVRIMDKEGHGSGVYLGHNYFLTAAHVVDQPDATIDGIIPLIVVWKDTAHDIALVRVEGATVHLPAANKYCGDLTVGQDLKGVGFPADLGRTVTRLYISTDVDKVGPWAVAYIAIGGIYNGDSGGPVYDKYNRLVGIMVGMLTGTSIGVIVPLSAVCKVLP